MAFNNAVDATQTGFQSITAGGQWNGRTLTAGSGINITNGDGIAGNPTISSTVFITVAQQVFTANGTYTPTAGMQYCIIECVGGGGGGGGVAATGVTDGAAAGAGGSGEYAEGVFDAATIGVSQAVTIGAAGAAGAAGNNAGGSGGNTSVGALISAFGAAGGSGGAASSTAAVADGGNGGTGGAGGSVRFAGQKGGWGQTFAGGVVDITMVLAGGSGRFGSGGQTTIVTSSAGAAATGFGAGGGGAINGNTQVARAGGAGTAGYVVVTEFI